MNPALQPGRPPGNHCQDTNHNGEGEQHQLSGAQTQQERPVQPGRGQGDDRDGEPDAGHCRPEREVQAGLQPPVSSSFAAAKVSGSRTSRAITTPTKDA